MSRLRVVLSFLVIGVLVFVGAGKDTKAQDLVAQSTDLLANGDFEIEDPSTHGFVWYYPNHFVALYWYRWWVDAPPSLYIPEYDDMRPGTARWPPFSGEHAQVYFKNAPYRAGIYQVVPDLTPCVPYEFSMYARSQSNVWTDFHAKIGLDPKGTWITGGHDDNELRGWSPQTQWSAEQKENYVWQKLSVTAEPLGTHLTAITYANPSGSAVYDMFWDAGSLYQRDFPDGRLPEPASWPSPDSQYINAVGQQRVGDELQITWNTTVPASTQVWYTIEPYTVPPTATTSLTYTIYFPLISKAERILVTALDPEPITDGHRATILLSGLGPGDRITFWVLSRRVATDVCITEGKGPYEYIVD
ncbi:MAG: hypothetical protein ACP5HS_06050 [Anaerolineae bacterium]